MRFSPAHMDLMLVSWRLASKTQRCRRSQVSATINGVIVVHEHALLKSGARQWLPLRAISVFHNQPINSLSWNQNPVRCFCAQIQPALGARL